MRIAHVAPSIGRSASGILTVIGHLTTARARRRLGVELWYGADDSSAPALSAVIDSLEAGGVPCRRIELIRRRGQVVPTAVLPPGDPVDVLHVHSVFSPMNTAVSRAWPGPLVVSPHGGYDPVSLRRSFVRKQMYSALYERRMIRRSATTVALTEVEAAQVRAYAGDVETAVVPNGVLPAPRGRGEAFRQSLGLPPRTRLALFVGRLDLRHKGLDRLVVAASAAPSWRVVLVGPDHRGGRRHLQRMVSRRGVSGRLVLVGQREPASLGDAYAAADLFVLPSRWEGLPMSLLEAMAQGIPCLVTPEVERLVPIAASGAGWSCPPRELGPELEKLATLSRTEWSKHSDAARDLARRYDWDDVAASHEDVYRAVLQAWTAEGPAAREAFPR